MKKARSIIKFILNSKIIIFGLILISVFCPFVIMHLKFHMLDFYANSIWHTILKTIGYIGLFFSIIYYFLDWEKIKLKAKVPIYIIFILLIISLISSYLSDDPILSLYGDSYRYEGYYNYLAYIGYFLGGSLLTAKYQKKAIYYLISIIGVILSIICMISKESFISLFQSGNYFISIFSNSNHFGYFLVLCFLTSTGLFMEEKKWYIGVIVFGINTILNIMLIMNNTLGCYLACALALLLMLVYYLIKKKYKILIILILFVGCSALYSNTYIFGDILYEVEEYKKAMDSTDGIQIINNMGSGRVKLWLGTIDMIIEKPLFGYGFENLAIGYRMRGLQGNRPHNIILEVASFIGIPGMLLYFFGICYLLIQNIKLVNKLENYEIVSLFVVAGYLISSMFGNSMYYVAPYFYLFLGLIYNNHLTRLTHIK